MKVTIKEIAEMAGVHRSTVDKVLHHRIGVSDEVRRRVQRIINESGYTPNPVGRALQKQGDSFQIATVLVNVDALPYLKKGIEKQLAERAEFDVHMNYYITNFQDIEEQAKIISKLVEDKVDGIILSPINAEPVRQAVDQAVEAGIPVFTTNSDIEHSRRTCYIGQDAVRAASVAGRLIGEFLGGQGRIAIVTSSIDSENNNYYVRVRETEFIAFLKREYPAIKIAARIESMEDPKVTFQKTHTLLQKESLLDAIYITCGGVAEVGHAVKQAGREKQIRILSYEDYPEILQLMREGVVDCTLGSDIEAQGYLPAQFLLDYLIYGKMPETDVRHTDIKILVKESIF